METYFALILVLSGTYIRGTGSHGPAFEASSYSSLLELVYWPHNGSEPATKLFPELISGGTNIDVGGRLLCSRSVKSGCARFICRCLSPKF